MVIPRDYVKLLKRGPHARSVAFRAIGDKRILLNYMPMLEQHALSSYATWLTINRVVKEASRKILSKLLELFGEVRR